MKHLVKIVGSPNKFNDLLYIGPSFSSVNSAVICFGGDIQDVENHQVQFTRWTLNKFGQSISRIFPDRHIFVVRPVEMYRNSAIFANFIQSDRDGSPTFSAYFGAFEHLSRLLSNACEQLELKDTWAFSDVILVGFSKGCVVLNQLVYELAACQAGGSRMQRCKDLINSCSRWIWLDGGHNGTRSPVWIHDELLLKLFVSTNARISIHVSPYQIVNPDQSWKGIQEGQFFEILRRLGANVDRTVHFQDSKPSLETHFGVIDAFVQIESKLSK